MTTNIIAFTVVVAILYLIGMIPAKAQQYDYSVPNAYDYNRNTYQTQNNINATIQQMQQQQQQYQQQYQMQQCSYGNC